MSCIGASALRLREYHQPSDRNGSIGSPPSHSSTCHGMASPRQRASGSFAPALGAAHFGCVPPPALGALTEDGSALPGARSARKWRRCCLTRRRVQPPRRQSSFAWMTSGAARSAGPAGQGARSSPLPAQAARHRHQVPRQPSEVIPSHRSRQSAIAESVSRGGDGQAIPTLCQLSHAIRKDKSSVPSTLIPY